MIFKSSRIVSLTLFTALILIPSMIVVLGSFKTDSEVYNKPLSFPDVWSLDNYKRLLSDSDLDVSFRNSVVVTLFSVFFTLLFASLASFAIARMITVSGKVLAVLFALGLAIPAQINLVPIYYIFRDLGLTNSFFGLVIINVTTTLPISIFILTAFFREISRDMYEASEVDGASPMKSFKKTLSASWCLSSSLAKYEAALGPSKMSSNAPSAIFLDCLNSLIFIFLP